MVNDCIVVMGKRPATEAIPTELMARAAYASIYWHMMEKKGLLFCVEGYDISASSRSGSEIVRDIVTGPGEVPPEYSLVRSQTNCTSREVLVIKEVMEAHHLQYPLVITHAYHKARVKTYLRQVGIRVDVKACSYHDLQTSGLERRYQELAAIVCAGEPGSVMVMKEHLAELILSTIHYFDPEGKFERFLSDRIRGDGNAAS